MDPNFRTDHSKPHSTGSISGQSLPERRHFHYRTPIYGWIKGWWNAFQKVWIQEPRKKARSKLISNPSGRILTERRKNGWHFICYGYRVIGQSGYLISRNIRMHTYKPYEELIANDVIGKTGSVGVNAVRQTKWTWNPGGFRWTEDLTLTGKTDSNICARHEK